LVKKGLEEDIRNCTTLEVNKDLFLLDSAKIHEEEAEKAK